MKFKTLLLLFGFAMLFQGVSLANSNVINLEDHREGLISLEDAVTKSSATKIQLKEMKKLEKQRKSTEKKMAKFQKFMKSKKGQKMLGGLDDPIDKYFWYWVIGWGAAIVLSILAAAIATGGAFSGGFGIAWILALIGWLAGLAGTVALVIWLIKKFS